jgi:hypothetical protein
MNNLIQKIKNPSSDIIESNKDSQPSSSLSDRMRKKKEKAKNLLKEKKKRDDTDNSSHELELSHFNEIIDKDFLITSDKVIALTDKLDPITKKEIKILRNRISAQKSRDKKKQELEELKVYSFKLFTENKDLRSKLKETEDELVTLRMKLRAYENSSGDIRSVLPARLETAMNSTIHHQAQQIVLNDFSEASRRNFYGRMKLGVLTGIILIMFLIGSLFWSEETLDSSTFAPRLLLEKITNAKWNRTVITENKNTTIIVPSFGNQIMAKQDIITTVKEDNKIIISENKKTQIFAVQQSNTGKNSTKHKKESALLPQLPNKKSNNTSHPLAVSSLFENNIHLNTNERDQNDYRMLGRKRYEFMVGLANKLRVVNSIKNVNQLPKRYFNLRDKSTSENKEIVTYKNYSDPSIPRDQFCVNDNDIQCNIKNEDDYFQNNDFKINYDIYDNGNFGLNGNSLVLDTYPGQSELFGRMEKNVDSMLCKDYIYSSKNVDMFDTIIDRVRI